MTNLIGLALPVLPFLASQFLRLAVDIHIDLNWWDPARALVLAPVVSIPISVVVFAYKVRHYDETKEEASQPAETSTAATVAAGFGTFVLSALLIYGLISIYVLLVMVFASDSSLVGVVYILAMPVVLLAGIGVACFRMKNRKAVLIFLALTVLPFSLYKWNHATQEREYFDAAVHMQRGRPTEMEWRAFFERYETNRLVTQGSHNQLDLVLWVDSIPQDILMRYVDHPDTMVRWSVARNPKLPQESMYEYLRGDEHLRGNLAKNPALPQDIIDQLLGDESQAVRDAMSSHLAKREQPTPAR